jgi:hypothetical protein
MESGLARKIWHQLEAIHAVAYFSPECRAGLTEAGLRGFWMGYFAGRAAPLGAVSPGVVEATFFNFHPAMVPEPYPPPGLWSPRKRSCPLDSEPRPGHCRGSSPRPSVCSTASFRP